MTVDDAPPPPRTDRAPRRSADKFVERRDQLAGAALQTLAELGYARTSLREIAQHSEFSHGVLHYYFTDKVELITYCVQQYKAECVTRYDQIVATAATADDLGQAFADSLAGTVADDASMHRLWYDLRNQSLFEEAYRLDVAEIDASLQQMIWRVVSRSAELAGRPVAVSPAQAYAICDGIFLQTLWRFLAGQTEALDELRCSVTQLLPRLLA